MSIVTFVAAVIAALVFVITESAATGAPQEAAGAAMALAIVVIPYCITATRQRNALLKAYLRDEI